MSYDTRIIILEPNVTINKEMSEQAIKKIVDELNSNYQYDLNYDYDFTKQDEYNIIYKKAEDNDIICTTIKLFNPREKNTNQVDNFIRIYLEDNDLVKFNFTIDQGTKREYLSPVFIEQYYMDDESLIFDDKWLFELVYGYMKEISGTAYWSGDDYYYTLEDMEKIRNTNPFNPNWSSEKPPE